MNGSVSHGNGTVPSMEWLPSDPPRIAPALMTAAEAAVYLRLTEDGRDVADAITSLEYLVREGRIRPARVGKHNRYARGELDRFIQQQTERYGQDLDRNGSTSPGSVP